MGAEDQAEYVAMYEDASKLFERLEYLVSECVRCGDLPKSNIQELCGLLHGHVRAFRETTGIFSGLTEPNDRP